MTATENGKIFTTHRKF